MKTKGQKIIAIIPARGGSEKIPNKNLKKFCGKPLIAWTISAAIKSGVFDRVIVSTDSLQIAGMAKKYGAETPFLRPKEIAGATIGIEPTLRHAYEWLRDNEGYKTDAIALLFATSPLRQKFHIREAIETFRKSGADSVVAVNETPANHTPYWTLVKTPGGKVRLWGGIELKNILTRRQDFPQKCYARNDLLYILRPKNLFEKKPNLYGKKVELYETSTLYEADINTPEEWQDAEIKFRRLLKNDRKKLQINTSTR